MHLLGGVGRKMLGMADEPRILVYEGRRFLRHETGPKVVGAKETGFENLPRLIISCVLTAVFMIGGGIWFANKIQSGELPFDSPWKWLALVFTMGPLLFFMGLSVLAGKRKPAEKPDLPPNPVALVWGFHQSNGGMQRLGGSLELVNGLIRVSNEKHTVEINRLEVEEMKIVEGRLRLKIAKFHSLPAMYLYLRPANVETGTLAVKREELKALVKKLEGMPTSILPSTYPMIERREFQRPPGTLLKCVVWGLLSGSLLTGLVRLRRVEMQPNVSEPWLWLVIPLMVTGIITMMTFMDGWVASSENKSLRKKGIVRD